MLVGISSPYRKAGLLYDKWREHYGKDSDRVLVVQATSRKLNPTLDQNEVAHEIAKEPEAAKSEWLGEFRDDTATA